MYDAAVIGAGLAGCAAAMELARGGRSVLLLDKSSFPRDKLCGEFLSPEAVETLEALGVGGEFRAASPARIESARLHNPSGLVASFRLPRPAFGISRRFLDYMLVTAAARSGVVVCTNTEIAPSDGGLRSRDGRTFAATSIILAAGRHSLLQPAPTGPDAWFGFKAHYEGDCPGRVELYFFRGGYCGISAVESGLVNVCALVRKRLLRGATAESVLASVPSLRARLGGLRRTENYLHAGPVVMGFRDPPPGLIPAGDAALFVDPFTGDGMALALATGRLAAQHVLTWGRDAAARQPEYLAALRSRFAPQLRAARLLRSAFNLHLLDVPLVASLAARWLGPAAFHATRSARGGNPASQAPAPKPPGSHRRRS